MGTQAEGLTIGALAARAGVGVETIRFYQREGLLAEPRRPVRGARRYGESDAARLRFIKSAQRLGFALADVAELLRLEDGSGCAAARAKAQEKLSEIRERLADLRRMEGALEALVDQCSTAKGQIRCPLIAALAE